MQLRTARLCLDCEEIHEQQECPVCLSEAFVYLTRWVPAEERRATRRPPNATGNQAAAASAAKQPSGDGSRWLRRGVVGLALVAASRWWWEASKQPGPPDASDKS